MFEGITGTSYTGDIGIDDVEVLDGACQKPGVPRFGATLVHSVH